MSPLFRTLLQARQKLYASGFFRTHRLHHPVISVGNLTLGGTGKTPLTIYLAQKMKEEGFRPVILSRGYRRRTRGTVVVSRGEGPIVGWQDAGDEPYLIAQRLTGCAAVVVSERRHAAGVTAEQERLGDLFLLDDGFQHRQLHRDVDLVTIDPSEWRAGERLLPTGRWREPKAAITRAHAACVQENGDDTSLELPIPAFTVRLDTAGIYDDDTLVPIDTLAGLSITAFAGIAKPERFFEKLSGLGLTLHRRVPFPDHHVFTEADIAGLHDDVIITTEKDAVKLPDSADFFMLRVSANIAEFDRLRTLILDRLSNSKCM